MDLIDGLKAFVATAQTGSFTEAAERLGISNRLTSKYVAQLEEKLGARLLQRTTRQVSLTTAGQELLSRAPVLLNQLDDMLVLVSEESKGLTGTLRISAPVTFGEMHLQDMLRRFSTLHPDISLDLRLTD
ncbi:LysR family transcriptional regulator, partial [Vibrio xuii]